MKKLIVGAVMCCSALISIVPTASAQGYYLDDYRGRPIDAAKNSLRRQGFYDQGHITNRRGTYALMYDGRTCIGLHGGRGVIDEITTFDPRNCDDGRRRPPPPPPPRWGGPPPPPPPWGGPPPPPRY